MRLRNVRVLKQYMPASFHTQGMEYRLLNEVYTEPMRPLLVTFLKLWCKSLLHPIR